MPRYRIINADYLDNLFKNIADSIRSSWSEQKRAEKVAQWQDFCDYYGFEMPEEWRSNPPIFETQFEGEHGWADAYFNEKQYEESLRNE